MGVSDVAAVKRAGRFFGRERDLAEIEGFLEDAIGGRGRMLLISGEAGIGKTRLTEEATRMAASMDMRVGWGRCWEGEGSPSYWPWVQILRSVLGGDRLGAGATDLGALVPEAREETVAFGPGRARGEQVRFRLFDAVAESLVESSREDPVLLVLDDLHWADAPSLSLLDFVARRIAEAHIAVIAAYRDPDADRDPAALGELSRVGEHLRLPGLDEAGVGHLIAATAGAAATPEVVASLHHETGGNPFFVKELVRLLAAQGDLRPLVSGAGPPPIPDGVREVVQRRLGRLSPMCYEILACCSVAGPELALEVVGPVAGVTHEELIEVLSEATEAGVIVEEPDAVGRYRFSHALVRATLYEVLGSARRRGLHARVGRTMEALHQHNLEPVLDRLAYHFVRAAPLGEITKAIDYSTRAGDRANASFGHEEAAEHYRRALQALQLGPADERRRCELLVVLGGAEWRAGEGDASRQTFLEAAGLARHLSDAELFAQVALGYGLGLGGQGYGFRADETFISLLWEALAMLGPGDSVLRVRVLGRLAAQLHWTDHADRGYELSLAAVEAARRLGDPRILLEAHFSYPWGRSPSRLDERLAEADRILLGMTGTEDREMLFWAHQLRLVGLAEGGDARGVRAAIEVCGALADELRVPHYRWQVASWRTGLALVEGLLEEAEELASRTLRLGEHVHPDEAMYVFGAHVGVLRWLQGRFEELEPALRGLVNTYPGIAAWRAALAWMLVEVGREDDARAELEALGARDFADLRKDPGWEVALWGLSLPCATLRDAHRAEILHGWLESYEDRNIVVGGMAFNFGSTALPIALLETAMGRWGEAERHFEMAQERNADLGNVPMGIVASREHAAMLFARGAPGDEHRARELLARALETSRERGLVGTEVRITRLAEMAEGVAVPVGSLAAGAAVLVLEGEHWAVSFAGSTIRLKDLKGIRDLARLLAAPGRELHVYDLLGGGVHEGTEAAIDDRARDEYKARLLELRQELEEAEGMQDAARAERARAETEAITSALASAYGLGGRARRSGDSVERARKAVTWRIRSVLSRIEELHPQLGRHLRTSIRTGVFCAYEPAEPVEWKVRTGEPAHTS